MQKKKILERLQEHLNHVIALGYDKKRILGIWLYGSQNYGFANDDSDIDSKVIILPTFEDFCLRTKLISTEAHLENGEHIDIKDIRLFRENLMKQNINFTETLFTEYFILNEDYKELFETYFIKPREQIVRMNVNKAIKSIGGQLIHTIDQDPTDNKKLYNGQRLLYFLQSYLMNLPYGKCIKPEGNTHNYLWRVKFGEADFSNDNQKKAEIAKNIKETAKLLLESNAEIQSNKEIAEAAAKALDTGVIEILKKSFNEIEDTACSKKDFFKALTHAEERAYYSIISEIHEEGSIVISKLVEKNGISRPVYNNLLNKMKEKKVALISNQGMKGTHIKITHPVLKEDAIDF